MINLKYKSWIVLAVAFSVIANGHGVFAEKKEIITNQEKIDAIKADKKLDADSKQYQIAQIELDRDMYTVYRVAERLIRANKLDNYPWTLEIPVEKDYKVNASADQGNFILLEPGLVYSFSDNPSTLAAVVAHEMIHNVQKHRAIKEREIFILKEELDEAKKEAEKGGNASLKELAENAENDKLALSRKLEYEADRMGLQLLVKAGFDSQGYIKMCELFSRINPTIELSGMDHPNSQNRIWQIEKELKSLNMQELKQEGKKNIASSKPLAYTTRYQYKYGGKYTVRKTITIHSREGSADDINAPFKKMFGK